MSEINRLPVEISNLISAGEVVERPASVVKELVENSIDAGAKKIDVEIRNGGISYIRVSDNGKGIEAEDMPVAFLRHATSKISCEDDLFSIKTLGFRGEALAAIASVSKIDIFSRRADKPMGAHMILEGGEQIDFVEDGCPQGTTIIVRDLFYNTPARMKFLKNDKTEAGHIAGILEHLAVSKPDISFKFIKDGRTSFQTTGDGDLKKAIYAVYGKEFSDGLIGVMTTNQGIGVGGVISPVSLSRSNRNMQNFFVNGRYVKSKLLFAALERAYQGRLTSGRMPICFLNITVPPVNVDVNVHPTKLEVKFSNEKKIFDAVYGVVTDALNSAVQFDPDNRAEFILAEDRIEKPVNADDPSTYPKEIFSDGQVKDTGDSVAEFYKNIIKNKRDNAGKAIKENSFTVPEQKTLFGSSVTFPEPIMQTSRDMGQSVKTSSVYNTNYSTKNDIQPEEKVADVKKEIFATWENKKSALPAPEPHRIIGEIFKTYIIVEKGDQLLLIDKHAVHEKMVYNKITSQKLEYFGQYLIEAVNISLTREEKQTVTENMNVFEEVGFEIDDLGTNIIAVRKAPVYISIGDIEASVTSIIDKISQYKFANGDLIDDIIKSVACKAAIKAGFINVTEELEILVNAVLVDPALSNCPHGRPTVHSMTRYQIEKMFKRS
ncbi:MAG: DNA mismatch repair endonuclease MutL [Ruminococcaceae bacterium]|nr:DNA mismatch repair endonuclease MutL [Oscillospiraceae bacterium]